MTTIFTIGYEATTIDKFVKTLAAVGIEVLADVRAVPLSRKKGFSKNSLIAALSAAGIQYQSYKNLGDPKPGREAARAGKYDEFRNIYEAYIDGEDRPQTVSELAELARTSRTCMLCFERDPKTCHRSIIAEKLVPFGVRKFDLYADDPARYEKLGYQIAAE